MTDCQSFQSTSQGGQFTNCFKSMGLSKNLLSETTPGKYFLALRFCMEETQFIGRSPIYIYFLFNNLAFELGSRLGQVWLDDQRCWVETRSLNLQQFVLKFRNGLTSMPDQPIGHMRPGQAGQVHCLLTRDAKVSPHLGKERCLPGLNSWLELT